MIVCAVILIFLSNVKTQTTIMREKVVTSNDVVSRFEVSVLSEGVAVAEYSIDAEQKDWDQRNRDKEASLSMIATLKLGLNNEAILERQPNVLKLLSDAEKLYEEYSVLVDAMPALKEGLNDARVKASASVENLIKVIDKYQKYVTGKVKKQLSSNAVMDSVSDFEESENAYWMEALSFQYYNAVVEGFFKQDMAKFEEAAGHVNNIINIANNALNNPLIKEKDQLTGIVEASRACLDALADLNRLTPQLVQNKDRRVALRNDAINAVQVLNDTVTEINNNFSDSTLALVNKSWMVMVGGSLIGLVISILMSLVITRSILGPLNIIVVALSEGAMQVDTASAELNSASNSLAEGATENAASLEQTSASLEQLTSMTKRNADNASEANSLVVETNDAVNRSSTAMQKVSEAMEHIAVSGNEIGKIIKTIDEIAFQTNLLALNAAVEAARAGEAGAGFAVVADEVRNLAIRSAEAAKNTAGLIEDTTSNINVGSSLVKAASEMFTTVATDVNKTAQLIAEVAEASKEQTQGINQISKAMMQMDKVTQTNAASSEETASSATNLKNQAEVLSENIMALERLCKGDSGRRDE
jgi:methyl-accepting chemotaxis protein